MILGQGLGQQYYGGSGGYANTPLTFASAQNRIQGSNQGMGANDSAFFYYPHLIGADLRAIQLGQCGYRLDSSGVFALTDPYSYNEVSVIYNGVAVPVTWGGSSSKTIDSGTGNNYHSDFLYPYMFGASKFARNSLAWIKGTIYMSATSLNLPHNVMMFLADVATSQYRFYNRSSTTPSAVNATGPFTWTGTTPATVFGAHLPFLLGYALSEQQVCFGVGDSVLAGFADTQSVNGAGGRGPFQRAMTDGAGSDAVCAANFSVSGIRTDNYNSNTAWAYWCQFANTAIEETGINGINSGQSLSTMQGYYNTLWPTLLSNGIENIIRTGISPVSSSTDSWATTANQTVSANYQTGGVAGQLNSWFQTQVGGSLARYTVLSSIADTIDTRKWIVNGAANYATQDGTHPLNAANGWAANDLRSARQALL